MVGVTSFYSLLRGVYSPDDLCAWAARQGLNTIGIWDHNNIYGLVRSLAAARQYGLQPVVGARLELPGSPSIMVVCRSRAGYPRFCELVTRVIAAEATVPPNIDSSITFSIPGYALPQSFDLIGDLCRNGWQGLSLIVQHEPTLERLQGSLLRDQLYVGLGWNQPHYQLRTAAVRLGIPVLAVSNGGCWVNREDAQLLRVLRSIANRVLLEDLPQREAPGNNQRLPSYQEFLSAYAAVPEAIENVTRLASECEDLGLLNAVTHFPSFEGLSDGQASRRLQQLCLDGIQRRYGESPPLTPGNPIQQRLNHELAIIQRKGFSSYFLVVHDIVSRFPRTCGRGSSAASIVSYLLGITHVDPLSHNLFFERFLHDGRTDPPDIDIDFPWDERKATLAYVLATYHGHAALVADHVTFGSKSAFRETATVFGFGAAQIRLWSQQLQQGSMDGIPEILLSTARRLQGIPRFMGTHPGGVVITPKPLLHYTTIQIARSGVPIIAWEKDAAEDAGLVKIDLLGNRSLAVLRDCLKAVERRHGVRHSWEGLNPVGDREVEKCIASGDTLGIFYIESPATRLLLKKMQRGDYEHVVAASSLIRPAAHAWMNEYLARLHGKPWGLWPSVDAVLAETYGIMVYQEDVSRIAVAVAGFSAAEADVLRKVLSRKDKTVRLAQYYQRFTAGCAGNGVPQAVIEQLWSMILSFDGYSFCKSHSASYAMVSFRLAYMKLHYPLEFYAAVINNGGGFYATETYMHAVQRSGAALLGVDVNRSQYSCTVEGSGIRLGLGLLQMVPEPFVSRLLQNRRQHGAFDNFSDFIQRLKPTLPEVRQFIRCGACDSVASGYTRPQLFWILVRSVHSEGQYCLIDDDPVPPHIGDYSPEMKLADEAVALGMHLSRHPVTAVRGLVSAGRNIHGPFVTSHRLAAYENRCIQLLGIVVTAKQVLDKNTRKMEFVTIEDEYGLAEAVLFPDIYRCWMGRLMWGKPYIFTGRVHLDRSAVTLQVQQIQQVAE